MATTATAEADCPQCRVHVWLSGITDRTVTRGDTVRMTGTCPTCGQTVYHDQKV